MADLREIPNASIFVLARLEPRCSKRLSIRYFLSPMKAKAMKSWFSPLLFLLASSSEDDLRRQIEFLNAEIEMLRKRVPKKRIFLENDEKERLLKLGKAIGPGVSKLITIVHPRTYQRWLERKSRGEKPMKKDGTNKNSTPYQRNHHYESPKRPAGAMAGLSASYASCGF